MCISQELYIYNGVIKIIPGTNSFDFATTHEYVQIVFNSSLHEMKKIFVFEGTI